MEVYMDRTGSNIFMNSTPVGKIPKSRAEEIKVSVLRNNMIDIRINYYFGTDSEPRPTKRGVWISFENLPKILDSFSDLAKDPGKTVELEFEKNETEKIRVYNNEFRGNRLVHIRSFYLEDDEYKPGKGVSFSITLLPKVTEVLKEAEKYRQK